MNGHGRTMKRKKRRKRMTGGVGEGWKGGTVGGKGGRRDDKTIGQQSAFRLSCWDMCNGLFHVLE